MTLSPAPGRAALVLGSVTLGALVLSLAIISASDRIEHSPITPDGAWKWIFVVSFIGCFLAYLGGLLVLRHSPARLAAVLGIAAAIQLVPLGAPLLLSTDVYGYWEYGLIGTSEGGNPYVDLPREFIDNPAHGLRGEAWTDWPLYYGPLFVAASEADAALARDSRVAVVWSYKTLATLAMLVIVALTTVLARRKAYAAAFVGWNPLLALHFAGGGHNDAWMVALLLGSFLLWRRGRTDAAGVLWVWSVAIKWVPLVIAPLDILAHRKQHPAFPWRGLAAGAVAVGTIATWRYGDAWAGAILPIRQHVGLTSSTSVPYLVATVAGLPTLWVARVFFLAFVAAYCWLLREAWRGRARRGLALGILLVSVSWLGPWYVLWCIPLAVLDEDGPAELLALALTAFVYRDTLPLPYVT